MFLPFILLLSCTYDVVEDTHLFTNTINTTNINVDNVNVLGNISINAHYAEGFYNDINVPIIINFTGANTFATVVGYAVDHSDGISVNGAATINRSGTYKVAAHIAFSGGNNGDYELSLFVNNVKNNHCSLYRSTSSTAIGSASFSCMDEYSQGDNLTMQIRDTSSPVQSASFYFINFNIFELI